MKDGLQRRAPRFTVDPMDARHATVASCARTNVVLSRRDRGSEESRTTGVPSRQRRPPARQQRRSATRRMHAE